MEASQIPQQVDDSASGWDRALYAFLGEKERRSGSRRTVEAVSAFLDHSSLQVTSVYLRRLEAVEDKGWAKVAEAIGLGGLAR
jgi:hypothetical protein